MFELQQMESVSLWIKVQPGCPQLSVCQLQRDAAGAADTQQDVGETLTGEVLLDNGSSFTA